MVFDKIIQWLDDYFSSDERKVIKQQKQQIDELTAQVSKLKQELDMIRSINEKLSENNKKLIEENVALKKEIENINTKSKYYDLICKVVEDDVLKQMIELSNQK